MRNPKLYGIITTVTLIGVALLISGGILGIPLLLGAGFAGILMACGAFISIKTTRTNSLE